MIIVYFFSVYFFKIYSFLLLKPKYINKTMLRFSDIETRSKMVPNFSKNSNRNKLNQKIKSSLKSSKKKKKNYCCTNFLILLYIVIGFVLELGLYLVKKI